MNALTIRCTNRAPHRINLFGVVPNRLAGLTLTEIKQLPIGIDEGTGQLGDSFQVSNGMHSTVKFSGDFSNCDCLGGGLENGIVHIEGNVGDFLAERMSGGVLSLSGSAGWYACSSLRGGVVTVDGNCGAYAAAALPNAARGMNGGTLVVRGNCDHWLATRMRRGTVIVHGDVAAGSASRMIAGTLILCGAVADPLAAHMVRGTILLLSPADRCVAPAGFTDPENTELSYLQILLKNVAPFLPTENLTAEFPRSVWRSMGDRVNGGLGEIIWGNTTR